MSPLIEKIERGEARLAVLGLGYVGLPLSVEFARGGIRTSGIDVDPERTAQINAGDSYVSEVSNAELKRLVDAGTLSAGTDFSVLRKSIASAFAFPRR